MNESIAFKSFCYTRFEVRSVTDDITLVRGTLYPA